MVFARRSTITIREQPLVRLDAVTHWYEKDRARRVLQDITLEVRDGEYLAVMGPSGSGKSTLLMIMGTLLYPAEGRVELFGRPVADCSDAELSVMRGDCLGFVFQAHHLLPEFTAVENVLLQMYSAGMPRTSECHTQARGVLSRVGLSEKTDSLPGRLSMGERQRVALSRAVAHRPYLLLCDEPTGSLDVESGGRVLDIIDELRSDTVRGVVVVTHNPSVAERADRIITLVDGQLR